MPIKKDVLSADQRLDAARERLDREGWSLVVITSGGLEHVSRERGVVPLLDIVEKAGEGLRDAVLADKVVGRAAAMLVAGAGFSRVYARVLSMPAREFLEIAAIPTIWENLVTGIHNRSGDGCCPMEALTLGVTDPQEALEKLRNVLGRGNHG